MKNPGVFVILSECYCKIDIRSICLESETSNIQIVSWNILMFISYLTNIQVTLKKYISNICLKKLCEQRIFISKLMNYFPSPPPIFYSYNSLIRRNIVVDSIYVIKKFLYWTKKKIEKKKELFQRSIFKEINQ